MNRIVRKIFIAVLMGVVLCCGANVFTAEPVLRFASILSGKPLSYKEDGVASGFFIDVFKEAATRAGYSVTAEVLPLKRVLGYLKDGTLDGCVSLYHKKEREQYTYYTKTPILISRVNIFVKKGKEFAFSSVKDLYGKRVGLMLGWAINNAELERAIADGKIDVVEINNYVQSLKMLQAERVDCILSTEQMTWYNAHQLGMADVITALDNVVSQSVVYMTLSKYSSKVSNPEEFLTKINAALDEMIEDGTYRATQERYSITTLE